jgi:uncharacterized protein DUF928
MRTVILGLLSSLLVLYYVSSWADEFYLDPLVPDHVGLTVKKSPVLYFYISHATSLPIHFVFVDSRRIPPVADVLLPSPTRPGYVAIRLEDYDVVLEEAVQYRWFVSVMRDPNSHASDIVAGGVIERVDPRLVDYYGSVCDRDSVLLAAKAGVWYDAFACMNKLIEANPKDRDLRDLREQFLGRPKGFDSDELPGKPMGLLRDKLLTLHEGLLYSWS